MPRIIPEPRYFSIPSIELGAEVLRKRALNCWPCARSLIHSPDAVIHSPAEMTAAWPTTVTRSRCPRAFALRTQKPFSGLWKVTRSTRPASTSCVEGSGFDFIRTDISFPARCRERCGSCHYESWTRETETESIACWVVSRRQRIRVFALRTDGRFSCRRGLDGFVDLRTGPSFQTAPLP